MATYQLSGGGVSRRVWQGGSVALVVVLFALFGATAQGASVTIEARSAPYVFAPSTKTIRVGDTVVWTIEPGDAHTITSGRIVGGLQVPDGKFDSRLKSPGQSYSHKFTAAGTYPYYCQIHADSGMKGTITVVAASPTPTPTPRPTPRPTLRPTPAPTSPPAPSSNPTAAVTVSPTSRQTPASVAAVSPVPTASLSTQPLATPSSSGHDVTSASDAAPLVAGILIAIAILGGVVWRARRNG